MLKLEYRAKTEEDINDIVDCAFSIRALVRHGKQLQEKDTKDEFFYEKLNAFDLIGMLLDPILTFLCDDAMDIYGGRKKIETRKTTKLSRKKG
jgi:hypothetical protein